MKTKSVKMILVSSQCQQKKYCAFIFSIWPKPMHFEKLGNRHYQFIHMCQDSEHTRSFCGRSQGQLSMKFLSGTFSVS